jgi:hypothetical protein
VVALQFNSGNPLPTTGSYAVGNVTSNTFTITAGGLSVGTYAQSVSTSTVTNIVTDTNNVTTTNVVTVTNSSAIVVTLSAHGLVTNNPVYLVFTTGGAIEGVYQVVTNDASHFMVMASDAVVRSGSCTLPKLTGGYTQSRTNVTISTAGNHSLNPGDNVFVVFPFNPPANNTYQVMATPDPTHFTIIVANSTTTSQNGVTVFPLVAPPLFRSGNVTINWSTWNMNTSDNDLTQTPLRSPTVFNFFLPDFKFPGILASAGLTTPEFQLTSDTEVANQMNFLYNGVIPAGNTSGLTSFKTGGGAIWLDLSTWVTPANTSNSGIPGLIDSIGALLMGGPPSAAVRTYIINYVANTTNFPYTTPTPTTTQMANRVRAVVHMLLISPDFTIQK